jgi:cell wall assembly regulator SMI1
MAEGPLLSWAQLEQLEALWAEQGAPLVGQLRPGLRDDEIESQLRPLGLRLPSEAALWWKWHDGVPNGQPDLMGGSYFRFLTLADSISEYHATRRVAETAARTADEADRLWHPSWFPITTTASGGVIACDCSVPGGSATPIRAVHWGNKEDSDVPVAESFGQMVAMWIDAIERSAWRYDTALGRWEIDHRRLADPLGGELEAPGSTATCRQRHSTAWPRGNDAPTAPGIRSEPAPREPEAATAELPRPGVVRARSSPPVTRRHRLSFDAVMRSTRTQASRSRPWEGRKRRRERRSLRCSSSTGPRERKESPRVAGRRTGSRRPGASFSESRLTTVWSSSATAARSPPWS